MGAYENALVEEGTRNELVRGFLRARQELAAVEARVAELEKAIKPFAAAASAWKLHADDELLVEPFPGVDCDLLVSDLRAAQVAIAVEAINKAKLAALEEIVLAAKQEVASWPERKAQTQPHTEQDVAVGWKSSKLLHRER